MTIESLKTHTKDGFEIIWNINENIFYKVFSRLLFSDHEIHILDFFPSLFFSAEKVHESQGNAEQKQISIW